MARKGLRAATGESIQYGSIIERFGLLAAFATPSCQLTGHSLAEDQPTAPRRWR